MAEASSRAALAHTGRLAGSDRTFDALCRELAAIRVRSSEELLDVALQLGSMSKAQWPRGPRVLVSTFGGGSGVMCTDQCERAGPAGARPARDDAGRAARARDAAVVGGQSHRPHARHDDRGEASRKRSRNARPTCGCADEADAWLFLAAGFDRLAPELVPMVDDVRTRATKPMLVTWQAMPEGIAASLAARGIYVFSEHARAVRALRHLVRYPTICAFGPGAWHRRRRSRGTCRPARRSFPKTAWQRFSSERASRSRAEISHVAGRRGARRGARRLSGGDEGALARDHASRRGWDSSPSTSHRPKRRAKSSAAFTRARRSSASVARRRLGAAHVRRRPRASRHGISRPRVRRHGRLRSRRRRHRAGRRRRIRARAARRSTARTISSRRCARCAGRRSGSRRNSACSPRILCRAFPRSRRLRRGSASRSK